MSPPWVLIKGPFLLRSFGHLVSYQGALFLFNPQITSLQECSYTAFVDILPAGKNYHIKPIRINNIGEQNTFANLKKDNSLKKEVNGKLVDLKMSPLKVHDEITMSFHIKNAIPEPYLGALGHVVIINQEVDQFLHVHPESDNDTVFKTEFHQPGRYKLWAEFKFDGEVSVFPFVMEVE